MIGRFIRSSRGFFAAALLFAAAQVIAASPALAQTVIGDITLDGNLAEWKEIDRVDIRPEVAPAGTRVYSKFAANYLVFGIVSPTLTTGTIGSVWLNVDENNATGTQLFGETFTGAEFNLTFTYPNAPILYTGGRGQTAVSAALPSAVGATAIEFAVPYASLTNAGTSVNLRVQLDSSTTDIYLPANYFAEFQYVQPGSARPTRAVLGKQVGVVYSATSAARFFDLKAYSQLYMSAQHQAVQAGLPYDTLSEDDLMSVSKLINYDAIIAPYFAFVPTTKLAAIENALSEAVNRYGVGLIATGDFLTNDQNGAALPGDPYKRTKSLLGVYPIASFSTSQNVNFRAATASHPSLPGYINGESIKSYTGFFPRAFDTAPGFPAVTRVIDQVVGATAYNAVVVSSTGPRTAHIASERLLGDTNIGWSLLRWAVYGTNPQVALKVGRQKSLFFSRSDVDQSAFPEDVPTVQQPLVGILTNWKRDYNYVGSYYLNIGNTPPTMTTNFGISGPIYQAWRALGNELGSHSYTHPDNTSALTPAQIQFEFGQSRIVLQQQLGVPIVGAAVPGNPETLATGLLIGQYYDYVTGAAALSGAGYPGAFGFLTTEPSVFYFSPNMSPDFTLIGFQNQTSAVAEATWRREIDETLRHSSTPILHTLWHDYGPTHPAGFDTDYTTEMYANTLQYARTSAGTEFVTGIDLTNRIKALLAATVEVTPGATTTAKVTSSNAGRMALEFVNPAAPTQVIANAGNWYAFDGNRIFLPQAGGTFQATMGTAPADVTRLKSLPMRSNLVSLSGNGTNLSFQIQAEGEATIQLRSGQQLAVSGAPGVTIAGNVATVRFFPFGTYNVTVSSYQCGDGIVAGGVETCDDRNTAAGDGCSNTCQVESGFVCTGQPSVCSRQTTLTATFDSLAAEDGWTLEMLQGYNTGYFFNATTNNSFGLAVGDDPYNRAYRGIVSFDTSSIPDTATIQSVTLQMTRGGPNGTNPFQSIGAGRIDIRNGFFGTSRNLEAADFQAAATATNVGSLSSGGANTVMSVPLTAAANVGVSKTARTQLRIQLNSNTNGNNRLETFGFYPGEAAAANRPKLIVTYKP